MAKYKSLVSTLFIYNKICENVKKLENFEISTYLSEKVRGFKIFRGGVGVCAPYGFDFWRGGVKTPPAHP